MVQIEDISKNLVGIICVLASLLSLLPCIYSIYVLTDNDFSHCNSALFLMLIVLTFVPILMFILSIINSALMCKDNYGAYKIFATIIGVLLAIMIAISIVIVFSYNNLSRADSDDEQIKTTATVTGQKAKLTAICALITSILSVLIIVLTGIMCTIIHFCHKAKGIQSWI